jgi:excinuclease ABC subunit C
VPTEGHRRHWFFVRAGQVLAAAPAPRDRRSAQRCRKLLAEVYPPDPASSGELPRDDPDGVALVAAWFRHHPEELERTLLPEQALEQCLRGRAGEGDEMPAAALPPR